MIKAFKNLYRNYLLEKHKVPEYLWQRTVAKLPVLAYLQTDELQLLREITTLFLYKKDFIAAQGFKLDDEKQLIIAAQACLAVLNLDIDYYDGWREIIVYPDTFVVNRDITDTHGLVHKEIRALSGESWMKGPVVLSWQDVQLDSFQLREGHNVVIHEFSHKLDMLNGRANGMPPLHPSMHREEWTDSLSNAYKHLQKLLKSHQSHYINDYAATDPAEFFAVVSEYFFTAPKALKQHRPAVYEQLVLFYKQDPESNQQ